jgi:hypothetical protein
VSAREQAVYKATSPRIEWRKLLTPFLFIMVLPSTSAILLDLWLGTLPLITIAAILIAFPLATFLVMRNALKEMDRVIVEVTPAVEPAEPEIDAGVESSSTP